MLKKALIMIAALIPSSNVLSAGLDLKLSSETAEVIFLTQNATFGYGGADIGIGLFINENDDFLVNGSILVSGSGTGDVRALHFGVGGKAYGGRLDLATANPNGSEPSGGAIAIGGNLRYVFPSSTPIAILVEAFWAGALRDAVIDGDVSKGSLMAGQSVGLVDKVQPLREIIAEMVADAESELERLKTIFNQ